ncbi:MAG: nickel pincer cofactor biosynthesis protein LarB [Anaerolineaceae bacterium]|nr:nickel pincer cofactor biosynthesis protein LarB [Anaerolineaceae bacterium]
MEQDSLRALLEDIKQGQVSVDQALDHLKHLPFEPVDSFANLDHHRALRTGFPEVIFAQGKTPDQVAEIFLRLMDHNSQVLATRVSLEMYTQIKDRLPEAAYHPAARVLYLDRNIDREKQPGILVLSAGTSDIPVAEEAAITAELMGNKVERVFDVGVSGLHRLLNRLPTLQKAHVIVVVAGMEGALPSVVGGLVEVPIVAVPTSIGYGASFQGLAALLGMLNSCASGVAVVNIDNGFGAGCLAAKINRLTIKGKE